MKITMAFAIAVIGLAGCASTTRSYDENGILLGSCEATLAGGPFGIGGGAICIGSSNPKDQGIPLKPSEASKCPEGEAFLYGSCYSVSWIQSLIEKSKLTPSKKCPDGEFPMFGLCHALDPVNCHKDEIFVAGSCYSANPILGSPK